jgi:membrane-associated protease RseP (regulator of RpoE activity)
MDFPPVEGQPQPNPTDPQASSVLRMDLLPPPGTAVTPPDEDRPRWGLAIGLFIATVATATTVSPAWYLATRTDRIAPFEALLSPGLARWTWSSPEIWSLGLKVALPALFILLCHELGHYIACRLYGIRATLPYFIPAPFGFGSLGAFIRIQSALRNRRELFDVGFAGPAAGFVALVPWLLYGIAHSTPVAIADLAPGGGSELLVPGRNLAMQLAAWPFHGWLGSGVVLDLHPFALGAWIGLFATALNLLPLSQLDGGHILYAAVGRWQHKLAWPLWGALALLSILWQGWAVWCVLLLWMRLKHPPVFDENEPLGTRRKAWALVALALLLLCFMPVPLDSLRLP